MNPEQVELGLKGISDGLRQLGVRSLSLFGSAATGTAGPKSDLDFIVEFDGPATFDRYMSLIELLQATFGRQIDLVTNRGIKPKIRDRILGEAIRVASCA